MSERATRELVDEVLQCVDEVPAALVDLIIDRTDGNPFFVEEVVKMLIDDGAIVVDPESAQWQCRRSELGGSNVPATLTGVLEARLDGLPDGTRLAVQRASVVGRVFWDEVVAAMADGETAPRAAEQLAVAVARELVYRRPQSSLEGAVEFIFKHALLRDVAYETVLLRDRRALHLVAAEWLTDHAGARAGELTEMIAEHYRLAGRLDAAAQLHFLAGERSLRAGRALAAHRSIERAVGLWQQEGTEPAPQALVCLAEASCRLGRLDEADALMTPLLGSDLDDDTMAWALYLASWVAADRQGADVERAFLDRALPLAERLGGEILVRVLIASHVVGGLVRTPAVAEELATRAIELAQRDGESAGLCRALSAMAMVQDASGRLDDASVSFHRALEIARRIGDLEAEARALGYLGVAHHLRGDADGSLDEYAIAADFYRSELAIDSRLGVAVQQVSTMLNLAQVLLRLDDLDAARSALWQAIGEALSLDLHTFLEYSLVVGADLLAESGDLEDALDLLRRVLSSDTLTWDHREMPSASSAGSAARLVRRRDQGCVRGTVNRGTSTCSPGNSPIVCRRGSNPPTSDEPSDLIRRRPRPAHWRAGAAPPRRAAHPGTCPRRGNDRAPHRARWSAAPRQALGEPGIERADDGSGTTATERTCSTCRFEESQKI